MTEGQATLVQVIGRHFQGDLVTSQHANAVLAHLAAGVGNQLVAVVQRDAKTGIGQNFIHSALHFNQFFFGQNVSFRERFNSTGFPTPCSALGECIFAGRACVVELANEPEDPVIFAAANGDRCGHLAGMSRLCEGSYYVVADTLCNRFCVHIESTAVPSPVVRRVTVQKRKPFGSSEPERCAPAACGRRGSLARSTRQQGA